MNYYVGYFVAMILPPNPQSNSIKVKRKAFNVLSRWINQIEINHSEHWWSIANPMSSQSETGGSLWEGSWSAKQEVQWI